MRGHLLLVVKEMRKRSWRLPQTDFRKNVVYIQVLFGLVFQLNRFGLCISIYMKVFQDGSFPPFLFVLQLNESFLWYKHYRWLLRESVTVSPPLSTDFILHSLEPSDILDIHDFTQTC